ncbi:MAG: hypothetical protein GY773_23630, partial [Actinomycetia bacterium]|nr:hypothetical protein [Actinomycetes bacterium]
MGQTDIINQIDILSLAYKSMGEHVMLRYGDVDADDSTICRGDGKHVGDNTQILYRLVVMLGFIVNQQPIEDTVELPMPPPRPSGTYWIESQALDSKMKYSIALPPGYEITQCTDRIDNDGDGLVDGLDPDCTSGEHTNEAGPEPLTRCNDGIDNDRRVGVDMEDPECESPEDNSESEFFEAARFPVIYVMHGYGQSPEDLSPSLLAFSGYMANGQWP